MPDESGRIRPISVPACPWHEDCSREPHVTTLRGEGIEGVWVNVTVPGPRGGTSRGSRAKTQTFTVASLEDVDAAVATAVEELQ